MSSASSVRLAIIDTDSGFVRVLTKRLDAAGWEYRVVPGRAPAEELAAMKLGAIVIDPAALGTDIWDYLDRVCALMPGLGVIVCSTNSTVAQRVRGLRLGADDWIIKPTHPEEVIARIEAVVRRRRRSQPKADQGPLVAGELEIRADRFQAFVAGRSADLTRREFELLQLLAEARGSVLEREDIYRRIWGYEMAHGDRSVDVFVRKVRQKIQTVSSGWVYIHTHFGVGYRFDPEQVREPAALADAVAEPEPDRGQHPNSDSQPLHTEPVKGLKTPG